MSKDLFKLIYKKIKQYDTIVIARHIGPDPDAVTSSIALRDSIKLTFKNKKVLAIGASVNRFKKFGTLDKDDLSALNNVLLIITDVPNLERVDGIENLQYKELIKIDHHPCCEAVGSIDLVDDTASSACQLVAELIYRTPLKLDSNIAKNLFAGIVSDSDRFLLSYTTSKTLRIASFLMEDGNLDITPIYRSLYDRPFNEIKFQSYIVNNLNIQENGLAYLEITPDILKEYNVDNSTPSNMINDFSNIKDILVWLFITYDEKNDLYKINIRSKGPIINNVAEKYNGGGHIFASGVRTKNHDDVESLIKDLSDVCTKYKETNEN